MERYNTLEKQQILDRWMDSNQPMNVYIHCPFCRSICEFCIYAGIRYKKEEFDNFYSQYLPNLINFYKPVFEKNKENVRSWFFGGGTPSLLSAEMLKNLLESIPHFKDSKGEKTFEIHPAVWTKELLEVLKEFNFDNIIICQQTFDYDTLVTQKRVPSSDEETINLTRICRELGFNICVDIISFLNEKETDELILKEDLKKVYEIIEPDQIIIQTLFQNRMFKEKTAEVLFDSKFILEDKYLIEDFNNFYSVRYETNLNILKSQVIEDHRRSKGIRLFKKTKVFDFIKGDFCRFIYHVEPKKLHVYYDTLALGAYKNPITQIHSKVKNFSYYEINQNNVDSEFKYVTNYSFFDEVEYLLKILKKCGEPPSRLEMNLNFENRYHYHNNIFPLHLKFGLEYPEANDDPEVTEYIKKVNDVFENEYKIVFERLHMEVPVVFMK